MTDSSSHDLASSPLSSAARAGDLPSMAGGTPGLLPPRDWTDQELLSRMLVREGKAWREFHRRFDRLVFRCIHKVTGRFRSVLSEEDVNEIYAQFLVNITARDMKKLRAYQPDRGSKLSSWIGLLATNTAWDHLRKVARRPATSDLKDAEELRWDGISPHDALVTKERWELVNGALRAFSQKDRDFVRLYYVDGLTPEEVAAEMNVSVKTVYSKKHKIRCRLVEALAETAAA